MYARFSARFTISGTIPGTTHDGYVAADCFSCVLFPLCRLGDAVEAWRCISLVRPPFSLVTPHLPFMYKESRVATCAPQDLTFALFIWLFLGFFVHQLPYIHDGLVPRRAVASSRKNCSAQQPDVGAMLAEEAAPAHSTKTQFLTYDHTARSVIAKL